MGEDYKKIQSRVKTVEKAVLLLQELALRAGERMDDFDTSLSNLTVKIEALADAQIHTEESLTRLIEAHTRLAEAQVNLAEAQAHSDKRLDALIDIVREGRNGK